MKLEDLFSNLNRIIATLVIILAVSVVGLLLYMYGGGLELLVSGKATTTDAFRDYDVRKNYGNGIYMVEIKDLITSAGGKEKRYYRYDISIETHDKSSSEKIIDTRKQVIAIINSVMSSFEPEAMNTEAERTRIKDIMQAEVTRYYPNVNIKDIYFTNFLHD